MLIKPELEYNPKSHEEVLDRVGNFSRSVSQITNLAPIHEVPLLEPSANSGLYKTIDFSARRFEVFEMKDDNNTHSSDTLWLFPNIVEQYGLQVGEITSSNFVPKIGTARRSSRHGVFFGTYRLEDGNGSQAQIPVAVRTHNDVLPGVVDLFKNEKISRCGIANTKHLGIQADVNGNTYVLSLLEKSLQIGQYR